MSEAKMIRQCSKMGAQGMIGYFIREKDRQAGDVTSLRKLGYQVYAVRQLEGKPFTIENRSTCSHRVGLAIFTDKIRFPDRPDIERNSPANYYTMNNQYSWLGDAILRRNFAANVNRPQVKTKANDA